MIRGAAPTTEDGHVGLCGLDVSMKETSSCVVAKKAARHAADDRGDRKRSKGRRIHSAPNEGRTHRISVASLKRKDAPLLLGRNPRRVAHFFFLALSYLSWNRRAVWLSVTSLPSLARISRLMP